VNITDVSDWLYFNPTGTMNMPEDTVATVGPGAFVIADALTSSSLAVTLDAGLTEMSLGTVNGLSFQVGDGSSDTLMTFSGSLADVNAAISAITVTPPSNLTGPVNINASVVDGDRSDTATLTINVLPVNDAPQITGPAQVNVTAGASAAVTTSMFTATDVDNVAQDLQFMLVTSPPSGQLLLDGVVIGAGGTFTQAQLAAGQITFTSLGGTDSTEQFTVEVRDPAGATDTQQIVVETTGGNAPPPPSDPGGSSDPQSNDPSDEARLRRLILAPVLRKTRAMARSKRRVQSRKLFWPTKFHIRIPTTRDTASLICRPSTRRSLKPSQIIDQTLGLVRNLK